MDEATWYEIWAGGDDDLGYSAGVHPMDARWGESAWVKDEKEELQCQFWAPSWEKAKEIFDKFYSSRWGEL